ncbi:MAG: TIM barrel protein [Chitinivibrionales bacterium]|nr:TIM barrel protein [Chitinivibrionales bacterium]
MEGGAMLFGVNLLLFNGDIGPSVRRWFPRIAELGFDGVEVPIFNPQSVPVDAIRRSADKYGLRITTSGALPDGARWYGTNAAAKKKALSYLRDTVRVAAELGSPVICGPLYKGVGDFDDSITLAAQRRECAKAMQPALEAAEQAGIVLAFEPLNRFETDLINTVEQGIAFCKACKNPSAGLLLDTFHMHIEEKDTPAAVAAAAGAGVLAHFHASENDRGVAGSGQVHWDPVASSVKKAYDRWVVLESFSQKVVDIRKAVSCWRPFYDSPEAFMRQGLSFVRTRFGK